MLLLFPFLFFFFKLFFLPTKHSVRVVLHVLLCVNLDGFSNEIGALESKSLFPNHKSAVWVVHVAIDLKLSLNSVWKTIWSEGKNFGFHRIGFPKGKILQIFQKNFKVNKFSLFRSLWEWFYQWNMTNYLIYSLVCP